MVNGRTRYRNSELSRDKKEELILPTERNSEAIFYHLRLNIIEILPQEHWGNVTCHIRHLKYVALITAASMLVYMHGNTDMYKRREKTSERYRIPMTTIDQKQKPLKAIQLSRTSRLRLNMKPQHRFTVLETLRLSHVSLALNDENSPSPALVPVLLEKSSMVFKFLVTLSWEVYVEVVVKDILYAFPTFSVLSALLKRKRWVCMLKSILAVEKRVNIQFKDNQLKVRSVMIKRNNPKVSFCIS
ncbi:hypothetical protein E3N88_30556 [Mikania micrantha]|uniref:Uncharacterized protein n=1 Tax=Mikania micrantha TaxID=192012 RepID=A0A5N6MMQ8_9ASTR|nr:hypothetical protein E3N88_30556 [Mikania micrantha]